MPLLHSAHMFLLFLIKLHSPQAEQLVDGPCMEACPSQVTAMPTLRVKSGRISQPLRPTTAAVKKDNV